MRLITFAGTPAAMVLAGMSPVTTAPAPSSLCCKNSGGWFLKLWCSSDVNVVEYQSFALWCCTFGMFLKCSNVQCIL